MPRRFATLERRSGLPAGKLPGQVPAKEPGGVRDKRELETNSSVVGEKLENVLPL